RALITDIDPNTGIARNATCGTFGANNFVLVVGRGIRIKQPNVAGAQTKVLIVGAHDPNVLITVPRYAGGVGELWFSVPLNSTAITAGDLCLSAGLTSTFPGNATIARVDAWSGIATTASCGTAGAQNMVLVRGEAVLIREPNGPKSFYPAHF